MDKFKLIAFGIVAVFAVALIAGFIVLEVTGRPSSTFIIFGASILSSLGVFGGLGYAQVKQTEKLDTIGKNVNGNSSKLIAAVEQLQAQLGTTVLTDEELDALKKDADKLPKHPE
jgi:hypothetical protein